MISALLIVFAITLNLTDAFGQEKLWTKQTKVSEAITFEKEISSNPKFLSQNVSLSKDYYPLADKYQVTNHGFAAMAAKPNINSSSRSLLIFSSG